MVSSFKMKPRKLVHKMNKKITFLIIGISILFITNGCLNKELESQNKYPIEITSLKLDRKDLKLIEEKEPSLISEIVTFRKKKKENNLAIQTVKDFIGLQICENPFQCRYRDFPNEFETILTFYESIEKNQFDWIQKNENIALKNNLLKFLTNHPLEESAMEHAIEQLGYMVTDPELVQLIYKSSIYPSREEQ